MLRLAATWMEVGMALMILGDMLLLPLILAFKCKDDLAF